VASLVPASAGLLSLVELEVICVWSKVDMSSKLRAQIRGRYLVSEPLKNHVTLLSLNCLCALTLLRPQLHVFVALLTTIPLIVGHLCLPELGVVSFEKAMILSERKRRKRHVAALIAANSDHLCLVELEAIFFRASKESIYKNGSS